MNCAFSIIIPHYNIPKLLKRCVDSIPQRDDIQIIVVDDCSPSNEEIELVFNELKLDNRVELYSTTKGGSAGRARNIGLEHAKGKWVMFADADDFFDECINDFIDKYQNTESEVIYFNFRSVLSDDITQPSSRESIYNDFFKKYSSNYHETDNFRIHYSTPWGKLIKRDFINKFKIRFDETKYANDVMFATLVGCKAEHVLVADIPVYVLTERKGSLANNLCSKPGETIIRTEVALRARKTVEEHGYIPSDEYMRFIRLLIWNKEYKDLSYLFHTIKLYSLSKWHFLNIVRDTGIRYLYLCMWLIWKDIILTLTHNE